MRKDYSHGLVTPEEKDQCLASIMGHLAHGDTHKLLEEILRRLVFQRNTEQIEQNDFEAEINRYYEEEGDL